MFGAEKGLRDKAGPYQPYNILSPPPIEEMMSKYHAKRTNGYASAKEAKRALELSILQDAGKIRQLVEQPSYTLLQAAPELGYPRKLRYVADFCYIESGRGIVIEDVKGFRTPVYKLKKRLMAQLLGITITEV